MSLMAQGRLLVLFFAIAAPTLCSSESALAEGEKRVALVVGNSAYQNIAPLRNPVNDATDIAERLRSLKFQVLLATDASQVKLLSLLREFRSRVTPEHVALFFYAGHGVTVNKESFLLPVDVPTQIVADEHGKIQPEVVKRHLISMASVLAPLEASRIGIVFLDACRSDAAVPVVELSLRVASLGSGRTVPLLRGAGFLEIKPSPYSAGVFRAYATQLDNVASDGSGRNSPFTKALLKYIGTKGLSIQELMIYVRKSVMEETKNAQVPWEEAALNESFYFAPSETPSLTPAGLPRIYHTPDHPFDGYWLVKGAYISGCNEKGTFGARLAVKRSIVHIASQRVGSVQKSGSFTYTRPNKNFPQLRVTFSGNLSPGASGSLQTGRCRGTFTVAKEG